MHSRNRTHSYVEDLLYCEALGQVTYVHKPQSVCVTECKFKFLTPSEANQTETSEFGAEKGLLQGPARRTAAWVAHTQNPQAPHRVPAKHL